MSPTKVSTRQSEESKNRTDELSRGVVLDVLSNERRRHVIHYLKHNSHEAVQLGDIAEHVAGWEQSKPVDALDYKERKRVKNALQQFHLPKMAEMGFVEYDGRSGVVELSPEATEQEFYVDVLPKRGIPWGLYYLGLSGVGVLVLVGLAFSLPLFSVLPSMAWGAFFVTALFVSSVGHFYDNYYRMRLGAREKPPEVAEA